MAVVRRTILLLGLMLRASGEQRSIKLVRGASAVDLSPSGSACATNTAPVADAMSGPASLSFLASRRVATRLQKQQNGFPGRQTHSKLTAAPQAGPEA